MGKKILVVDDSFLILEALGTFLIQEGFIVRCAEKAVLIDSLIDDFEPDLIILDIKLGDVDGRVVCNELKQRSDTEHLPIIMLTGLTFEEIAELDCYADAILGKPYESANLLLTINQLLSV